LNYPAIKEALVLVQEEERGDKYICAYIVSNDENVRPGLREYLSKELPDYMIPSYFVLLEKMPLTPNGKIDRKALPKTELKAGKSYVAPRDEVEEKLVGLWSDILGGDALHSSQSQTSIGIDDNFFELGGHSLKATILASRIEKIFNVKTPLSEIFKSPRIRELAGYIKGAASRKYEQIELVEEKEYYALSSAQKRLYFLQQMDKSSTAYNIPSLMIMEGIVEKDRLEQSIRGLIRRHESLRTSIDIIEEDSVQRIHKHVEFEIEYYNLSTDYTDYTDDKDDKIHPSSFMNIPNHFIRHFDLSKAPLLRVGFVKLEEEKHIFLVDMHHIISDGMSTQVLIRNFSALYIEKELPEIKIQYKDYAEWQNRERVSKKILEQGEFWKKEFEAEIPVLELPTDYARPAVQSFEGSNTNFEINKETSDALKTLALETGTTLYILLLTLYTILLSKLSNQEDIVIGCPVAGRRHADLEKIIGMFVNTLALRNYPAGEKKFTDFLEEVKGKTLKAFENQEYQYEDLVENVAVTRDVSRNPMFDTMLALQNMGSQKIEIHALKLVPYECENKTAQFDLSLTCVEVDEKLHLTFEYSTKLFREETIERFAAYFINIIECVIENSRKKISDFEIITEEEKKRILFDFNDTEAEYPKDKTIHRLFEEQVERIPDRIAVFGHGQTRTIIENHMHMAVTYFELNEKSDRLAYRLQEKGVEHDTIVGIIVERSIATIIGILGILKAGGAYMPIDSEYPQARIDFMVKDSGTKMLVATSIFAKEVEKLRSWEDKRNLEIVSLGRSEFFNFAPSHPLTFLPSKPSNLAYIIYTSGSTGRPKGVMVEHRSVVNLVHWFGRAYRLQTGVNLLQLTGYNFDPSVEDIFSTLVHGASLYVASRDLLADMKKLREFIRTHRIHIIDFIPALLKELLCVSERLDSLQVVISGGERLEDSLKDRFLALGYRLYNHYGPTEITVDALVSECSQDKVTLGIPIANTQCFILDRDNNPAAPGVPGELCIAGVGLARGYLNCPELTAEKFGPQITLITQINEIKKRNIDKSFVGARGAPRRGEPIRNNSRILTPDPRRLTPKFYKTGDQCCWLPDGNLRFCGRIDDQIKIRGYRIELQEIENVFKNHKEIKDAVVLTRENKEGKVEIYAYYVDRSRINPVVWPSLGEYPLYDDFLYYAMTNDNLRNYSYKAAISRKVADKVVVEIGTGKDVILARFCVEAGARIVYAIEISEESFKKAQHTVKKLGFQDKIVLIHGDASSVEIPEKADICLSELIGTIGGSEGVAAILKIARRFLKENGEMIPDKCITKIAAVQLPLSIHQSPSFSRVSSPYVETLYRYSGHPFDFRICIDNFPSSSVISSDGIFEYLDFSGQIETEGKQYVELVINKDGRMDGLLLWLNLYTCPSVVIDNLVNRHSWAPVFVPVMYPGIAVSTGDRIRMTCSWSLSRNGINPDYRLEGVLILKDGTEIFFQYELPYFETAFLKNPFYRQLLIDNPAGFARNVFEYLDQRQLRKYLEAHLPSYMMPSHLIELEKIPLTPNGKVDKRALIAIISGTGLTKDFMPPKSNTEKIIAQIWKEVLELDTVGVTDNFFEIGGTSLDIIRVTNRMKEALNRDIPVVHLFQYSNISTLAEYFAREESDNGFSGDDRVNAVERGKKDRFKRLQMKRGGNK
ncbi:MAG: hypothetical protein QG657_2519, partial [Acidobacteriota bacterium]|nr:hypothetical protein [Acidobacteriota bacterium]